MSGGDRTALVTGAAQGIGAAVADRLAAEGFTRILLVDRDAAGLARTVARLEDVGVTALPIVADLADVEAAGRAIRPRLEAEGRLHALVNAAGLTDRGGLEDTSLATFDRLFAVNTRAPFFLMQWATPHLAAPPDLIPEGKADEGGVIVNMASMLAHGGPPFLMAYSASKAALVTLTRSAANALKRRQVRVFAINLGWTVTPAEHRIQTEYHGMAEDWARTIGDRQPFGRLLTAEDAAGVVAFLVSPAARMMTGAVIDLEQFVNATIDQAFGAAP